MSVATMPSIRPRAKEHSLRDYVIRRILLMIPTFLGTTLIVFVLCQMLPGGPIDQARLQMKMRSAGGEVSMSSSHSTATSADLSDKNLQALKEYYGYNDPIPIRYLKYLKKLARLDLGTSFRFSTPAIKLIAERLPISLYFGILTTIFTYGICIPLGVLKAIKHRTTIDNTTSIVIFVGYAVPNYAFGVLLLSILSVQYDIFPFGQFTSPAFETFSAWEKVRDILWHTTLPLICWMLSSFAFMTMLMKNGLLEAMSADYVRTFLAMGASPNRAVFYHAFRNSLIPLATSFGNNISLILAGSLLIEQVFDIPGMGRLFYECITSHDYPVVMAITVISTVLLLVGNLLSDICVALVDPRVRFR